MRTNVKDKNQKIQMDYMQAHSLRELISKINFHNTECPNNLILKDDIVMIFKEEDTFILLYYK